MRRGVVLVGASAVGALAALAGVLAVALSGGPGVPAPRAGVGVVAQVSPPTALFGDEVEATVDAVVDPHRVRPDSLDLRGTFAPYVPVAQVAETRDDAGGVARVKLRLALRCLEPPCLPPDPARGRGSETVQLPAARLRFVRADGRAGSVAVRWPTFDVASRLPAAVAAAANPAKQPNFRATLALPRVTYAVSPVLLEWLLAAGGLVLLAVAAALGVAAAQPALVRGRGFSWRRRREPIGLERALLLLRRAQARESAEERRKALELLAFELRRSGEGDLAGSATTLAWSEPPPASDDAEGLAAAVRRRLNEEANGRAGR
jgi:hypothetical protein